MRGKSLIITAAAAILSGVYWFVFFLLAETWTATDYRAGMQPSETWLVTKTALVFLSGPLVFGFLIAGWREMEDKLLRKA